MFTSSLKVNECHNTSLLHHLTSIAKLNPSHSRLQNYNSFAMTFKNKLTQSSINNKKVLRRLVKRFWLWWFFLLQKFFFFFVFFQQFITSALNVFWTRLPIVRELCAPVTKRDFQKLIIVLFNPKAFYTISRIYWNLYAWLFPIREKKSYSFLSSWFLTLIVLSIVKYTYIFNNF